MRLADAIYPEYGFLAERDRSLALIRQALSLLQSERTMTNLTLVQESVRQSALNESSYTIDLLSRKSEFERDNETYYRDLALIAAVAYLRKNRSIFPSVPDRLLSGWHRESRRLPG